MMSDASKGLGRSVQLRLSASGREAVDAHRVMIEAARSGNGRAEFEAACTRWAAPRGLVLDDGVFLVAFADGPRTAQQITRDLAETGTRPTEVKDAVMRLIAKGMLERVPVPPDSFRA
jgi:hypothetical protein